MNGGGDHAKVKWKSGDGENGEEDDAGEGQRLWRKSHRQNIRRDLEEREGARVWRNDELAFSEEDRGATVQEAHYLYLEK